MASHDKCSEHLCDFWFACKNGKGKEHPSTSLQQKSKKNGLVRAGHGLRKHLFATHEVFVPKSGSAMVSSIPGRTQFVSVHPRLVSPNPQVRSLPHSEKPHHQDKAKLCVLLVEFPASVPNRTESGSHTICGHRIRGFDGSPDIWCFLEEPDVNFRIVVNSRCYFSIL